MGTQLNKGFATTRFYYHKGNKLNKGTNVLLPRGHPTKQMFYYHKGTQLNKCFTTTRVPN